MANSRDPRRPTRFHRGSKRYGNVGGHSPPGDDLENTRDHERIWFELRRTRSCCDCEDPGFKFCFETFDWPNYICDGDFPGGETMVGYWPGSAAFDSSWYIPPGCTPDELRPASLIVPESHDTGSWRNGPYSLFNVNGVDTYQANFASAGRQWNDFFPNQDRTLEAWIKPSAGDISNGRLFITGVQAGVGLEKGGLNVYYRSDGALAFEHIEVAGGALQTSAAGWWEADQWHHFVVVRNASNNTIAFYINGRLAINRVLSSTGWDVIETPATPDIYLQNGSWADIAYYTSALSAATIRRHYQAVYGVEGVPNPVLPPGTEPGDGGSGTVGDPGSIITEPLPPDLIDGTGAVGSYLSSNGDVGYWVSPEDTPFELEERKGVADGYAELDADALLPLNRIATTGTPSKQTFLRGDREWVEGLLVEEASEANQILVSGGGQDSEEYVEAVLADTPAGYWKLDENGVSFNDLGSLGIDLIPAGNPAYSAGTLQLFLGETTPRLDGTGDWVKHTDNLTGGAADRTQWAMSGWFFFESIPGAAVDLIVEGKGSSFPLGMRISATGKLEAFNVYSTNSFSIAGATTLEAGRWYHLAIERFGGTNTSGTVNVYVDGVLDGTGSGGYAFGPDLEFRIGDTGFIGRIGHVAFWINDSLPSGWAATHFATRARRWVPVDPATLGIGADVGIEASENGVDVTAGVRSRVNFIPGPNVTIDVVDDAAGDKVDVTIDSTGGGAGGLEASLNGADVTAAARARLNLIEGDGIDLTVADDAANDEIDVTIALSASQKACSAYTTAGQSIPYGGLTLVNFENEYRDDGGFHDLVTNNSRLTVPEDGWYVVTSSLRFADNSGLGGTRGLAIVKNGDTTNGRLTLVFQPADDTHGITASVVVYLVAGDYVEVYAYQDNTGLGAINLVSTVTLPTFGIGLLGKVTSGGGGGARYVGKAVNNTIRTLTTNNTFEDIPSCSLAFTALADKVYIVTLELHWRNTDANWRHHVIKCLVDGATTGISLSERYIARKNSNGDTTEYLHSTTTWVIDGLSAGAHTVKFQSSDAGGLINREFNQTQLVLMEYDVP